MAAPSCSAGPEEGRTESGPSLLDGQTEYPHRHLWMKRDRNFLETTENSGVAYLFGCAETETFRNNGVDGHKGVISSCQ